MKLKMLKYPIIAFVLSFALVGCLSDEIQGTGPDPVPDDGTVQLELFTRAPEYDVPSTSTRMGSAQENMVDNTPWVLVFRQSGASYVYYEAAQAYRMASKTFVNVQPTTSPSKLLVLANRDKFTNFSGTEYDFSVANFDAMLTNRNLEQAEITLFTQALTGTTQTTVPFASTAAADQLPLPMSGVYEAAGGLGKNMSVGTVGAPFKLSRTVAKVVVSNSASNFVLDGATVINAVRRGTVFRVNSEPVTNLDRIDYFGPTAANKVTGIAAAVANGTTQTTASNPIYVYESNNSSPTHTQVIIQGSYKGRTNYYKLSFRDPAATTANPNATLDVLRNNVYTFNIGEVLRSGYSSLDDAIAATHASNEDVVWRIDVTDNSSHDIVDNGEFYLGVTNSRYIVYADGALTGKSALTVRTNRLSSKQLADNSITVSGTGLSLVTANQKIALASSATNPGTTDVRLNMTAAFTEGTVTLRLGDLEKVITVKRYPMLSAIAAPLEFTGDYLTANIESGDWLTLSTDGENERPGYVDTADGNIYVHVPFNFGATATANTGGIAYLSRRDEEDGRTKLDLSQGVIKSVTTPASGRVMYVGTFHRASEVGERLIRLAPGTDIVGAWTATVIEGKDFIALADGFRGDGPVWPYDDNNAEAHPIPAAEMRTGVNGVVATSEELRFRVGMRSKLSNIYPDETTEPRYGLIALSYNDGARFALIYVRQGEAADYLIPNGEQVTGGRTIAKKFSPYNLTVGTAAQRAEMETNGWTQLDPNGGGFTEYPTQGGSMFQYSHSGITRIRYTYNPISPTNTWNIPSPAWPTSATAVFDPSTMETCPPGYRRPVIVASLPLSETTQSLQVDVTSGSQLRNNSVWGYYADGYYDRRNNMAALPAHVVSSTTIDAGYIGRLIYNNVGGSSKHNASIFYPAPGARGNVSPVVGIVQGRALDARYWGGSDYDYGMFIQSVQANSAITLNSSVGAVGSFIRCVKE